MGDLIATCISPHSRNRHVGEQLGAGRSARRDPRRDDHGGRGREDGRHRPPSWPSATASPMPVCDEIYQVVTGRSSAADAYRGLRRRRPATSPTRADRCVTRDRRRARLPDSSSVSDIDITTLTSVGWLSPEHLELVRAHVPLVYVDAVPVRVDGLGGVTEVGLLLRVAADGSISRMVVQRPGAVRRAGPRRPAAPPREGPRPAGPAPRCPLDPAPFTVVEYFPDPRALGLPRPPPPRRQPGLRRAGRRRLPADPGGARPGLVHAAEAVERGGARADDRRPRPPDPPRPRPRRRASRNAATVGRTPAASRRGAAGHVRSEPMPEGDTIHRTASALRTALVDQKMVRFEAPRLVGHRAPGRAHDRARREPRQAPRDRVGRRRHPAHPHAHERVVAPLPPGRAAGSARTARCGPLIEVDGVGGGVLQRPGRRDVPRARRRRAIPDSGGSGPTSAASTPTSTAASSCCSPTTTRSAIVAEVLLDQRVFCGRRQRLPLRGAVGRAS